jgi:AP-3 complex subunit sigma
MYLFLPATFVCVCVFRVDMRLTSYLSRSLGNNATSLTRTKNALFFTNPFILIIYIYFVTYHFVQPLDQRESVVRECFNLVSKRPENVCNFLEDCKSWGKDVRLIYRHYATLYFIFAVDESESELGILDLIQVFVEALDKCFENVCELDLVFHIDQVHHILDEVVMAGMVLETNLGQIMTAINGSVAHERATKAHKRRESIGPKK